MRRFSCAAPRPKALRNPQHEALRRPRLCLICSPRHTSSWSDPASFTYALIAAGRADPQRLYYGGWSWGGYITAWTIGHTRRYRAAMVGAGIIDAVTQYVGSDINHGAAAQ